MQHRTNPLLVSLSYTFSDAEDRLNHWEIPEDSSNPELDHADSGVEYAAQLRRVGDVNIPGRGIALEGWRVSAWSTRRAATPYTIRYAADLTGTTQVFCTAQRTCNVTTPEGRNTARSAPVRYADSHADAHVQPDDKNRIEVRADVSTCSTTRTTRRTATSASSATSTSSSRRAGAYPGRQFQFGAFIASNRRPHALSRPGVLMRMTRPIATTLAAAASWRPSPSHIPRLRAPSVCSCRPISATSCSRSTRRTRRTRRRTSCAISTAATTTAVTFHRTVKMDNQPDSPVKIEVIQAGVNADRAKEGFPPIPLEANERDHAAPHRTASSRWRADSPTARPPLT